MLALCQARFSSPFEQLASTHINSHDIKQMVANAVKISEADVIGQTWFDKVYIIRFDKDLWNAAMSWESWMHLLMKVYYLTMMSDILMKSSKVHKISW